MKAVPLHLVFGFLGSGKTTFLKIILDRLGSKKRIGLIQNEFSLSQIESEFLNQSNIEFSLMEVNRGSLTCLSQSENFIPDLVAFIKRENPEILFIEASGLSDPIKVIKLFESPLLEKLVYLSKSYVVVDASRFYHEVTFLRSIRNQIKHAETVILNKYDKLNRLESPEEIVVSYNFKKIESWISDINPFAPIIPTTYSDMPKDELDLIYSEGSGLQNKNYLITRVITTDKKFSKEEISAITQLLTECFKAKGYILNDKNESLALRAENGNVNIIPYNNTIGSSEIILIGENNKISSLTKHLFR
ncbi:MAG: GTP-binding protein [Bacteroidales bacterium]|nr:GTP-binding protein [Bacteroidales bacterium]